MQQRRSRRPLLRVHHNPRLKRSPSVAVKDRSRRSSASPRCQPPRKRTSQRQSPLRARAVKSQLAPDWLIANVNDCETAEPASTRSLPPPPHGRRRLVPRPPTGGRLGVRMSRICKPDRRPRRTRSCQPPPRPSHTVGVEGPDLPRMLGLLTSISQARFVTSGIDSARHAQIGCRTNG